MRTYREITTDKGWEMTRRASDNKADYILTSARMHDLYNDYIAKYDRIPTAAWYRKHAEFECING